jgi:hypothetical protein
MAKKQFEQYLSRRILGNDGSWLFFCRVCGMYLPENQFYKSKEGKWGLDSRCKIHYTRKDDDDDPDMDYLKLNPISETDFIETQKLLERLGYQFGQGESVHEQFLKRHKLP